MIRYHIIVMLFTFYLLGFLPEAKAQKIEVNQSFASLKFTQYGREFTLNQLHRVVILNPEATRLAKRARVSNFFGNVFAFSGGFMIGYPIGAWIAGADFNYSIAAVGGVFSIISFGLNINANKRALLAVHLYNKDIENKTQLQLRPEFSFSANSNGIGVRMRF